VNLNVGQEVRAEAVRQHEIDSAAGFEFLGQREVVAEASILGEVGRPISLSR
jgi:hypothetical protein